ncbi:TPA: alkyl hydroperoxide reductase [Elizabethkingia anophelis]|nr:alkyl hydroperoxide reductase [Elizabethkingia anophelis]
MNFPTFSGKTYDFIIFQGSEQITIKQDTIPAGGKFILAIPKEYAPYTGMSRWLITGTKEGGGLDMYIPGKNFSVICTADIPNNKNIIYNNNIEIQRLNELYQQQEKILQRYNIMRQAIKTFSSAEQNYPVFQQEYKKQINFYNTFQNQLKLSADYISQFIQSVNITMGISSCLSEQELERATCINQYITDNMNWNYLYTSGYWTSIINIWLQIQVNLLDDIHRFKSDFIKISSKIESTALYADFASKVAFYLNQQEKTEYIKTITPVVTSSGKINKYKESLLYYSKK